MEKGPELVVPFSLIHIIITMKIFIFTNPAYRKNNNINQEKCQTVLYKIASSSNTDELITTLYLIRGPHHNRGTAYVRTWMNPTKFITKRGKWAFSQNWPIPKNLPEKYRLIRLRLDGNEKLYPKKELDMYGWIFEYVTFYDHLATLFAHELHHFRRYHLGLHPNEGENAANQWALNHVQNLGFQVRGKKQAASKRKKRAKLRFKGLYDPFSNFRHLKSGATLMIVHDPRKKYIDQHATVVRPIQSNSRRIVIQTQDGKIWRWPMTWVRIETEGKS
jgi:hypothetical protein